MDAYISKPIQFDELLEVTESRSSLAAPAAVGTADSGWEPEVALARVGGDQVLLADLAKIFCEQCPRLLAAVKRAIAERSLLEVKRAAHSLRSAILTFPAQDASDAATRLEGFSRPEDFEDAPAIVRDLELSVERLRQELEIFAAANVAEVAPPPVWS
jgi:two-component system, sensor histidine kinase and response regulator